MIGPRHWSLRFNVDLLHDIFNEEFAIPPVRAWNRAGSSSSSAVHMFTLVASRICRYDILRYTQAYFNLRAFGLASHPSPDSSYLGQGWYVMQRLFHAFCYERRRMTRPSLPMLNESNLNERICYLIFKNNIYIYIIIKYILCKVKRVQQHKSACTVQWTEI